MTALYILTSRTADLKVLVRAACFSCARKKAAEGAGPEGPMMWRDPSLSSVEFLDQSGKQGVILRGSSE